MKKYTTKTECYALQNWGRDNEWEIMEFLSKLKIPFQIIGEFKFEVTGPYGKYVWGFGEWLVWWSGGHLEIKDNPAFHQKFQEIGEEEVGEHDASSRSLAEVQRGS